MAVLGELSSGGAAGRVGFQVDKVLADVARLSRSMDGMPTAGQMSADEVGQARVAVVDGYERNLGIVADRLRVLLLGVQLILDQHADELKATAAILVEAEAEAEAATGDVLDSEAAAVETAIITVTDRAANDAETLRVQEERNQTNSQEDH